MSGRATYVFGPPERGSLLGGLGPEQALLLLIGALIAVGALDLAPSGLGALGGLLGAAACAFGALAPVAGMPLCKWLPAAIRFGLSRRRRLAGAPGNGVVATPAGRIRRRSSELAPPPFLHDVGLATIRHGRRPIGALVEAGGRRHTAVLACRAGSYAMLDREAQERQLATWGRILAATGTSGVRRLAWIERTAPAAGDELARHLHESRDQNVPLRGIPLIDSYLELIDSSVRVSRAHEILLAVQVETRSGDDRTGALAAETERIARALEATGVSVLGALPERRIARVLREAFDPYCRTELAALTAGDPSGGGAPGSPWPAATREAWDHFVADGAQHATWWIAGWPRTPVSPMFMEGVLARTEAVRTVAITFEPVPPGRSTREIEAQITRDRADVALRRRFGQAETARQRQAVEANARREEELALGHGEVRLAGFVTVSGRDADELRAACAEMVEHAARSHLELRRLYGRQAEAFTYTLPLCRGLR